jgi:hypothetical protein
LPIKSRKPAEIAHHPAKVSGLALHSIGQPLRPTEPAVSHV